MISIIISATISTKLQHKHNVTREEVSECFANRCGVFLADEREDHKRHPPTLWFVAETRKGRLLKVVFQVRDSNCHIITAYEANADEIRIYENKAK